MRTVTREEYYAFIQSERAKIQPIKIERVIHHINGIEHIVEGFYALGGQKAQAVLFMNLSSYIIIED
jgi:hypothetical protein